jgi:hypothetical protein
MSTVAYSVLLASTSCELEATVSYLGRNVPPGWVLLSVIGLVTQKRWLTLSVVGLHAASKADNCRRKVLSLKYHQQKKFTSE